MAEPKAETKPKRYLAFSGDGYQPGGGWNDLIGSFDFRHEAVEALGRRDAGDFWQIVDLETGESEDGEVSKHFEPNRPGELKQRKLNYGYGVDEANDPANEPYA